MENFSIADVATLVGIFILLWTKFFSKSDRQKLIGENVKLKAEAIKVEAETNKIEVETADKYEDVFNKLTVRNEKLMLMNENLNNIITSYDEKFVKINKRVAELERDNRKLKLQIAKRDAIIDCLEIEHRELAQKAIDAGLQNISLDTNCFSVCDDEDE